VKLTLIEKIEAIIVGLFVVAAVVALVHRDGVKKGAVKQELKENAAVVKDLRAKAVVADKAAAVEVKKSVAKRAEYHAARAKVEVKGDTVFADGRQIEMPSVVALIKVADSRGDQDSTTISKQAAQDTANKAVDWGLGKRVNLLEHEKQPLCGRKCGIAIGVAGAGVVVIVAVHIINALGHR
jgi:hypothetical protein